MDCLACSEFSASLSNPLSSIFLGRGELKLLSKPFDADLSNCCGGALAVQTMGERAIDVVGAPRDFASTRLRRRTLSSGCAGVDFSDRDRDMDGAPCLFESANLRAVWADYLKENVCRGLFVSLAL